MSETWHVHCSLNSFSSVYVFCFLSIFSKHIDINLWQIRNFILQSNTISHIRATIKQNTRIKLNFVVVVFFIVLPLPMAELDWKANVIVNLSKTRRIRTIHVHIKSSALNDKRLIRTVLNRKCVYQNFDTD